MATIREVASRSGVSTATVSHVVNGKTDKVSAETRDRVLAAIRDLRYRPPAMEDRQRALLSKTLAVIVPDLQALPLRHNEYVSDVIDGVLQETIHGGWSATIFAERVWDDVGQSIRRSYDGRCDGTIVIGPGLGSPLVEGLVERGVPVVLVGTTAWLKGCSSVDVDNVAVGVRAAEILLEAGHSTFAYIGPGARIVSSSERERAFRGTLVKCDVHPSRVMTFHVSMTQESIAADVDAILESGVTAALCWNDDYAARFAAHCRSLGLSLPERFSLIGVDDGQQALESIPRLSTFRQDRFALGRMAAELLVDLVRDPSHGDVIRRETPEFIPRESVAAPPRSA